MQVVQSQLGSARTHVVAVYKLGAVAAAVCLLTVWEAVEEEEGC